MLHTYGNGCRLPNPKDGFYKIIGRKVWSPQTETTMDELLNKFLAGEITDEVFNGELAKLSEDDKKLFDEKLADPAVKAKLSQAAKSTLDQIVARRKELAKIEDKKPIVTDFGATMRKENVDKAAAQFFKTYSIPAEEQAQYRELFEKNDSGAVGVDLIEKDFKRIYATLHSDELLGVKEQFDAMKDGADDFNARSAGSHGGSGQGGGEGEKKFSPAVLDWVKESAKQGVTITPEAAEKILSRGMKRTF